MSFWHLFHKPGRSERILAGLKGQNEPAEFDGQKGFWCQADCVLIPSSDPAWAIVEYRSRMAKGSIGISHNHFCSSISAIKDREKHATSDTTP